MKDQKVLYTRGLVKSVNAQAPDGTNCDILATCSTAVLDRDREVIHQDGWQLERFRDYPVMLAGHQHRLSNGRPSVIGAWPYMDNPQDLEGGACFSSTDLAKDYKTLYVDDRHMKAVSVGFLSLRGEYVRDAATGVNIYHHRECELIEVSAVAVGANQEALVRLGIAQEQEELAELLKTLGIDSLAKDVTQLRRDFDKLRSLIQENFDEIALLLSDGDSTRHDHVPAVETNGDEAAKAGKKPAGELELKEAAKRFLKSLANPN
jgi:hypothetical protein